MFLVDGMSKSGAGFPTFAINDPGTPSVAVAVAVDIMFCFLLVYDLPQRTQSSLKKTE
jgi:hypothetical protein